MKVFIWAGGHTIAQSIFKNPPEGFSVVSNVDTYSERTGKSGERMFVMPTEAKEILDGIVYATGFPRILPHVPRADLIHTVSGLVPLVPKPWVTSISMPSSFFGLHDDWYESKLRRLILLKILRSYNCKYVTSFSKSTLDGLVKIIGPDHRSDLADKLGVMYPAIDPAPFSVRRVKDDDIFRILFVGNHFFDKGGRELHRAASKLAGRYDIRLDLVTDAPPHHKKALDEYIRNHQEEWVRWHVPGLSRKRLIEEFYPAADVFVMCSYMDPFGFVFIEAMASGLPIIAANVYAQREIVADGENGWLVDVPITPFEGNPQLRTPTSVERYRNVILDDRVFDPVVDQLVGRLTMMIEDEGMRSRMGTASRAMTTDGRFAIRTRNERLRKIYRNALDQ